jgi:hypothetical protein
MDHPDQDTEGNADFPISRGLDRTALKDRMKRFARIRAAERVLPSAATNPMGLAEDRVAALRSKLTELGSNQTPSDEGVAEAFIEIDAELDLMARAVLARCDGVDFSLLRSTVLRALTNHRGEVLSLLEVLLEDRAHILARLPKIEYLITILSTEEVEDRRAIVHDPVSLSPFLVDFDEPVSDPALMDSIAMELYQAANAGVSGTSLNDLRQLRHRKAQLGLQTLNANMLRAVVTYNARIFNRMEDSVAASRASDADIESLLGVGFDVAVDGVESAEVGVLSEDDEIWNAIGRRPDARSVFDSNAVERVIEASRRRLKGVPIGSCSSERVALTLDMSLLEPVETDALAALEPDEEQSILAHTAVIGLVLRDLGAVRSDLIDLGVDIEELTSAWITELGEVFTRLVAEKLADGTQYAAASVLSGIKTKHLLAPLAALKNAAGRHAPQVQAEEDSSAADLKRLAREALLNGNVRSNSKDGAQQGLRARLEAWSNEHRFGTIAAMVPLVLIIFLAGANTIGTEPSTVEVLESQALTSISPLLESAYRSEHGHGPLLVGRIDDTFARLGSKRQVEIARRMKESWEKLGVREAMVYDGRNRLQIHFTGGQLRRPKS